MEDWDSSNLAILSLVDCTMVTSELTTWSRRASVWCSIVRVSFVVVIVEVDGDVGRGEFVLGRGGVGREAERIPGKWSLLRS